MRGASVKDCFIGEGGFGSLDTSFRRALCQFEGTELRLLVSRLFNLFICKDVADSHSWKHRPSAVFLL